jgi:hypothetical protein
MTSIADYRTTLADSVYYDPEREEIYLQLPSFPDLRLTPLRQGDAQQLVCGGPILGVELQHPYKETDSITGRSIQYALYRK